MKNYPLWKIFLVFILVSLGVVFAIPSILYQEDTGNWYLDNRLNLGLDLQGGSYLLLEVQTDVLIDEEFEDTIDSDVDTFVTTRQQGTSWMGEKLRDYHIHEGQQHFFGWKNIVNWFANRRSTPMNTAAHVRYTRQDETN